MLLIQPNQINNNFISDNSLIKTKQTTELIWNNEHQLTQSITTKHRAGIETVITTDYAYDAFGRRINKYHKTSVKQAHQNISQAKVTKSNTFVLWDADRQLQEYTDTHVFTTIYEVESFEPIARLTWLRQAGIASNDEHIDNPNDINIYHYHNDHLGTPQELTNTSGNIVWQCHYEAWGNKVAEYIDYEKAISLLDKLGKLTGFQGCKSVFLDQKIGRALDIVAERHDGKFYTYEVKTSMKCGFKFSAKQETGEGFAQTALMGGVPKKAVKSIRLEGEPLF